MGLVDQAVLKLTVLLRMAFVCVLGRDSTS